MFKQMKYLKQLCFPDNLFQRYIQNYFKHLKMERFAKKVNSFAKHFILNVWQGFEHVSVYGKTMTSFSMASISSDDRVYFFVCS